MKPRGRGRPRKYPLPDPAQPKPNKRKKATTDVTKIVTRKQSQSSMSSRVSTLLSSINRDVTDTDSDTGKMIKDRMTNTTGEISPIEVLLRIYFFFFLLF